MVTSAHNNTFDNITKFYSKNIKNIYEKSKNITIEHKDKFIKGFTGITALSILFSGGIAINKNMRLEELTRDINNKPALLEDISLDLNIANIPHDKLPIYEALFDSNVKARQLKTIPDKSVTQQDALNSIEDNFKTSGKYMEELLVPLSKSTALLKILNMSDDEKAKDYRYGNIKDIDDIVFVDLANGSGFGVYCHSDIRRDGNIIIVKSGVEPLFKANRDDVELFKAGKDSEAYPSSGTVEKAFDELKDYNKRIQKQPVSKIFESRIAQQLITKQRDEDVSELRKMTDVLLKYKQHSYNLSPGTLAGINKLLFDIKTIYVQYGHSILNITDLKTEQDKLQKFADEHNMILTPADAHRGLEIIKRSI